MFGHKESDFHNVSIEISPNQEKTPYIKGILDYWGFYDYEKEKFTIIQPSYTMLEMCYANGFNFEKGNVYRLIITKI